MLVGSAGHRHSQNADCSAIETPRCNWLQVTASHSQSELSLRPNLRDFPLVGRLQINSLDGRGTELVISVPVEN